MLELVIGIFIGVLVGAAISNELHRIGLKGVVKTVEKAISTAYEEGVKFGTVEPQLNRINEISREQAKYLTALDQPNASAAHARHKNSIVSLIQQLEKEKFSIIKTIVESGNDVMLRATIDGKDQSLRISDLYNIMKSSPQHTNQNTDPKSPSITKGLRLAVDNTKENKDVKPKPSDPTIH
jgi:hypothetical protein